MAPGFVLRHLRPSPAETGRLGERLAARRLARGGLALQARRLRTPQAEIDLLFRGGPRGETWIAVEVKTGTLGPVFRPSDRLRPAQRRRLERALAWLAPRAPRRVDLVEIALDPRTKELRWFHQRGESTGGRSGPEALHCRPGDPP